MQTYGIENHQCNRQPRKFAEKKIRLKIQHCSRKKTARQSAKQLIQSTLEETLTHDNRTNP